MANDDFFAVAFEEPALAGELGVACTVGPARRTLAFTAVGVPAPQGSMRAFVPKGWTRPVVRHDSGRKLEDWRAAVAAAAGPCALELAGVLLEGAVTVTLDFTLPRPASLPRRVQAHIKRPDLDKLVRAVKDALTSVLYVSDSQVVALQATKRYAGPGAIVGVAVRLEERDVH